MFDVLLSIAISFTITFLAIPAVINVAEMKKLFDMPDERKVHHSPITPLGGLGVFAGFVFGCLLTLHFNQYPDLQYFMAASLVIFFLGLKDDILIISPVKKFIGQVLAAFIIIYYGGIQIRSMNGFLGIYQLPEMFSLLLTYFAVIVVINSFNLIDGIDGLAGSLGLLSTVIFGIYFLNVNPNMLPYAVVAFSLAGSLLAFLIFNFQPAKIFMGDTGSLLVGTINAILVIKFINVANSEDVSFRIASSPAVGFTILMVPLLDTLRVFGIRMFNRRSPFSPDRNHIHHLLLDKGFSHKAITFFLVTVNAAMITLVFLARNLNCTVLIFSVIAIFFSLIGLIYYMRPAPRLFVAKRGAEKSAHLTKASKLVTLAKDTMLEQNN
ncbi:MraY family glycosyltransferase [Flavitalea sp. BT771]|uniref:glycosyltransferase family 4 protein n=1 Tax=Flavitalea sp. BT771 TaxID=3063329 RepID=UPI0026E176EA|nr:MraY family glycosyltransferase [Flavitalea sp. BT771]MDO6433820.1 MraY family glycosyltransferase [Flavitalea sp. BT771]MDV6222275.1 MraY family glycosyltransferase [Flavitalea sp. BT771]